MSLICDLFLIQKNIKYLYYFCNHYHYDYGKIITIIKKQLDLLSKLDNLDNKESLTNCNNYCNDLLLELNNHKYNEFKNKIVEIYDKFNSNIDSLFKSYFEKIKENNITQIIQDLREMRNLQNNDIFDIEYINVINIQEKYLIKLIKYNKVKLITKDIFLSIIKQLRGGIFTFVFCGLKMEEITKKFEVEIKQQMLNHCRSDWLLLYIMNKFDLNEKIYLPFFSNEEINKIIEKVFDKKNNFLITSDFLPLLTHKNSNITYKIYHKNKKKIEDYFSYENIQKNSIPGLYPSKEKVINFSIKHDEIKKNRSIFISSNIKEKIKVLNLFFQIKGNVNDELEFIDSDGTKILEKFNFKKIIILFFLNLEYFEIEKIIEDLINFINNLIFFKLKKFYFLHFFHFNKNDDFFVKDLKLFTGIENFLKNYNNFVQLEIGKEKTDSFKFEIINSLCKEKLFDEQEIKYFSYFLKNERNFHNLDKPLELRNKYVHEGFQFEGKNEENKDNYLTGLILFIEILLKIIDDINLFIFFIHYRLDYFCPEYLNVDLTTLVNKLSSEDKLLFFLRYFNVITKKYTNSFHIFYYQKKFLNYFLKLDEQEKLINYVLNLINKNRTKFFRIFKKTQFINFHINENGEIINKCAMLYSNLKSIQKNILINLSLDKYFLNYFYEKKIGIISTIKETSTEKTINEIYSLGIALLIILIFNILKNEILFIQFFHHLPQFITTNFYFFTNTINNLKLDNFNKYKNNTN